MSALSKPRARIEDACARERTACPLHFGSHRLGHSPIKAMAWPATSEREYMPKRPRNIFGDRDWTDVRKVIIYRLRKRFPRVTSNDDLDDAASLALVDLVDYWVTLPTSVVPDDPDKTFWQACKRGTWMATTFLVQEWDARPVPVEALSDDRDDAPQMGAVPTSPPTPEETVIADIEHEELNRFVSEQFNRLGDWLTPFLNGTTTREQARIEGVSQQSLAGRWQRRMATFVTEAHQSGLGGVLS